jgi:hypothetical protein
MKLPIPLLLGFVCIASGLLAYAPHPTVLTVKYKDKLLPVLRVEGTDPFVMVDGKEVRIRSNPVYLAQDATTFSDNFVTAPRGGLGGTVKLQVGGDHAENFDMTNVQDFHMDYDVTMSAKETLKGGYLVLVMYAADTFSNQPGHSNPAEVIVHEMPEMPAGKNVQVKFFARRVPRTAEPRYFVQIYDATGKEVRTSQSSHAWKFYGLRDRARFDRGLEKYLAKFKGADHDAVPAITPKPLFNPGAKLPEGEVNVTLTVEPDGTVSAVDAGMIASDSARDSLTETVGGWLFLPKLKAGQPVPTRVQVPLQF